MSIEALTRDPTKPVSVHVPTLESRDVFASEMAASGLQVRFLEPTR